MSSATNSFGSRSTLRVGEQSVEIHRLDALDREAPGVARLPWSLRILLEALLRHEDGSVITAEDVLALARWEPGTRAPREISFHPARVLLQDFTGVPAVVDLAAMREAMVRLGGDPARINPLEPVELVIDHSVQIDVAGSADALRVNTELEYQRNRERYTFLRWGQQAFDNFRVVPPGAGIVHQVNLEHLARVVFRAPIEGGGFHAYPDTLVGTDSHTTMINGLGVLGWGVGGIEAEAAMLGQPVSMLIPDVVGFKLRGRLPEGATATDLVLTVTQILRAKGVVGKFVEFYGPGIGSLPLADRATIANMAPEYGATCGFFPVDAETLRYLRLSGRREEDVELVEAYCKEQGLFLSSKSPDPAYSDSLELDLGTVEPSLAGPRRPQDRVALGAAAAGFAKALPGLRPPRGGEATGTAAEARIELGGASHLLRDGTIVIAAITSCTNTSNPSVMVAAGLVARKAAARGLKPPPWVKTSLAPGSRVVTAYLEAAGLRADLAELGFHVAAYGCTTCIGNSGPIDPAIAQGIESSGMVVAAVLSGNRNFEGRIHPLVRANYLMSPPLVVAYALAGRMDIDLGSEPLGKDSQGHPVFLRDVWPTQQEVTDMVASSLKRDAYESNYASVFQGDQAWRDLPSPTGQTFSWSDDSTYIRHPPFFEGLAPEPETPPDIRGARVLAVLGDSVTTDHISPAGSIHPKSPAADYLRQHGIAREDFNSYGSRRGNHEVMMRGTFANVRLRNLLAPGTEGGVTRLLPGGETMTIFEASERYRAQGVPLLVIAGREYGTGSSRDWAAKGPALLGVRAVLARSYERIHRSNLVGMGIAPLEFRPNEDAASLGLNGEETYAMTGLAQALETTTTPREVVVRAESAEGRICEFRATLRLDTPQEVEYYRHGGILSYVLRQLMVRR